MSILTETYDGVPAGMNLALPAQELTEFEARYLQDILLDYPGLVRQRGAVIPKLGYASAPKPVSGLVQTLDPNGTQRLAVLYGDNASGSLGVYSDDFSSMLGLAWNGPLPTSPPSNPYSIVDSKAALTGGAWIGTSSRYDSNTPIQTLALWRGGNRANYTTGTLSVTRGGTAVTGAGTAWLANVVPGMFLFCNTDDPYTNTYLGVVKSVNSDTSITLGAPALHTATAKAYTAQSIRGFCPRVTTGRITCAVASPTVNGALTKFIDQGVNSGTWQLYRASDLTYIGKVTSVASNIQLTLTANAAIALNNERYLAFRIDGDYSINSMAVAGRKVGFLTAIYAERQWYANLGQQFETTSRIYFSDSSDPEAVDLSAFDGDYIDVGSSHGANTPIKAIMPASSALVVLKDNEAFGIFGTDKTQFQTKKIGDDGCLSGMSVQPYDGGVIWAGRNGINFYDGITVENVTDDKLGAYYQNAVRSFDPTSYRMWSMIARNHYFLFMESLAPSVPVIKGTVSNTPTKMTICINMVTKAITVLTNVNIRGSIVLPASTGETTWYVVNSTTGGFICDTADLFDTETLDTIACDQPRNLLVNPGFEDGTTSWATNGGGDTIAPDLTVKNFGNKSVKLTAPGGSNLAWCRQLVSLVNGKTYALSAYVKGTPGNKVQFWLWDFGAGVGTGIVNITLDGSWQRISQTFACTLTSSNYYFIVDTNIAPNPNGVSINVDGCQVVEGASPTTFIEGAPGPDFYMESKKYKVGDSMRKKLFKQLAINYLAQGGVLDSDGVLQALQLDTVVGLNNIGKTSQTKFPSTVPTWDSLPALYPTWDALGASVPTWDALVQAVFRPKRIKFLKRSQHLAFRIYKTDPGVSKVRLGPFQLGFKMQRPGRI
jgi:hypothetical protein